MKYMRFVAVLAVALMVPPCLHAQDQEQKDSKALEEIRGKMEKTRISFKYENKPLSEIIHVFANKIGISVSFSRDAAQLATAKITLEKKDISVREALEMLTAEHGLKYEPGTQGLRLLAKGEESGDRKPKSVGTVVVETGETVLMPPAVFGEYGKEYENVVTSVMRECRIKHCPAVTVIDEVRFTSDGKGPSNDGRDALNQGQKGEGGKSLSEKEWERTFEKIREILRRHGFQKVPTGDFRKRLKDDYGLVDGAIESLLRIASDLIYVEDTAIDAEMRRQLTTERLVENYSVKRNQVDALLSYLQLKIKEFKKERDRLRESK